MLLSAIAFLLASVVNAAFLPERQSIGIRDVVATKIQPKVFIISAFDQERDIWRGVKEFNVFEKTIEVPGTSPVYPNVFCTATMDVCQVTTGEAEINAAATITALVLSPAFDLTKTYFLIAGIAGVNPKKATIGGVTFGRYEVQVTLQYEFDAREKPNNFLTGYVPQGSTSPDQFPQAIYGTEVFELNAALRARAVELAKKATLQDSTQVKAYRQNYAQTPAFVPGASSPSVVSCDGATSDTFWSGRLLSEAFENTTKLFTGGKGTYCATQQENSAIFGAIVRGAKLKLVDFTRVISMRAGSNFDRPHASETAAENLFNDHGGFPLSLVNLQLAGLKVIQGILNEWNSTFAAGVKPSNYVGDILRSLEGTPDFPTLVRSSPRRSMFGRS